MENPQTPARILVVDDEPDIRNILHILLSSRGYAVDEAENGLRAVACVRFPDSCNVTLVYHNRKCLSSE